MNDLVEVRGRGIAFEIRNGARVEYANGDREARMRALGCPDGVLKKLREKRSAAAARRKDIAALQGTTPERLQAASDEARRSRARLLGKQIAEHETQELRKRAAQAAATIAADAEQARKDEALRERMFLASGRTCR